MGGRVWGWCHVTISQVTSLRAAEFDCEDQQGGHARHHKHSRCDGVCASVGVGDVGDAKLGLVRSVVSCGIGVATSRLAFILIRYTNKG